MKCANLLVKLLPILLTALHCAEHFLPWLCQLFAPVVAIARAIKKPTVRSVLLAAAAIAACFVAGWPGFALRTVVVVLELTLWLHETG